MSEFERRIREARIASREIATQVQQVIDEGKAKRRAAGGQGSTGECVRRPVVPDLEGEAARE